MIRPISLRFSSVFGGFVEVVAVSVSEWYSYW